MPQGSAGDGTHRADRLHRRLTWDLEFAVEEATRWTAFPEAQTVMLWVL